MKGITWSRDSHGLFDYESRHLTKRTLKAEKQMILLRKGNELQLLPYCPEQSFHRQLEPSLQQPEDKALLKIINKNGTFYLESATYQHHAEDLAKQANEKAAEPKDGVSKQLSQESMYLVVRSLKHNNEKMVSHQKSEIAF